MAEEERTENAEKEEKKTLSGWLNDHPKSVFATRLVLWTVFSAVLPFAFIAWRYGIFTSECKIKLTGWGFIAIVIAIVFLSTLVGYLYKLLKPGLVKQCITGLLRITLPLVVLTLLVHSIANSIRLFEQALICVTVCETVGIPINPFPELIAKVQEKDENTKVETTMDLLWDKFFKRKKDE